MPHTASPEARREREVSRAPHADDPAAHLAARTADATHDEQHRRHGADPLFQVRSADLEPYVGLRYLSKLFRLIAVVLVLLLVAEVITGLATQGSEAVPTLVSEGSRLIVLAGLLWGVGDLVLLLIDLGHDVRASRILLGRQVSHHMAAHHVTPGDAMRPSVVGANGAGGAVAPTHAPATAAPATRVESIDATRGDASVGS